MLHDLANDDSHVALKWSAQNSKGLRHRGMSKTRSRAENYWRWRFSNTQPLLTSWTRRYEGSDMPTSTVRLLLLGGNFGQMPFLISPVSTMVTVELALRFTGWKSSVLTTEPWLLLKQTAILQIYSTVVWVRWPHMQKLQDQPSSRR